MIDRETVEHVAALARLELTEEETERMSVELSAVLEHVERISELDLSDVEPTTHVVEVENALRADEITPSLSLAAALDQAPSVSDDGFAVPSPGAS